MALMKPLPFPGFRVQTSLCLPACLLMLSLGLVYLCFYPLIMFLFLQLFMIAIAFLILLFPGLF
jgi:hypothetical protein